MREIEQKKIGRGRAWVGKERELEGIVVTHTVKACKKGEERHDLHSQIQALRAWKHGGIEAEK